MPFLLKKIEKESKVCSLVGCMLYQYTCTCRCFPLHVLVSFLVVLSVLLSVLSSPVQTAEVGICRL